MNSFLAKDHKLMLHAVEDAMTCIGGLLPGCVFHLSDLHEDFFDLSNRLAGEIFQKFVNYRYPVAFVIPPGHGFGPRLNELMREHRQHPYIRFFSNETEAVTWVSLAV